MKAWMMAIVLVAVAGAADAAPPTPGTYMLEGGSYTISVEMAGANLLVQEPNRDSTYTPQSDGSYQTYSEKTGSTYGMRAVDERTIEAFKPGTGGTPTRLVLQNKATPTGEAVANADSEKWEKIANDYLQKTQSDPANVQSWAACGAVAMKRAASSKADADAYASEMAGMLRQMDSTSSPCPEVFTF